ncbi:hypothetical protein [Segetibacter aerophilus]|uniref:Uncharacterized protein n=1 Tax=Segetibacter aerophilus TaxID=670293 RepID=A0A512B8L1_9BACT|nr:hypothetical protein [Segetibacter aerophilus]GEO08298.1 hypothetical protein SAE01_07940 [Segetibacter aerophilus]
MKLTKQQRQEQRNSEFCQKYLTADWDGCAANDYFANKVHPNPADKFIGKPNIEFFDNLLVIDVAENNLYTEVAALAFEKSKIVSYLSQLSETNILIPTTIGDSDRYLKAYLSIAREILSKIERAEFDFQGSHTDK